MNPGIRQRIDLLIPLLKDPVPAVRTAAASAIERLEAANDLDGILNALKTGDTGTRVAAIHALGVIGGEKVIAPLVYCAKRPETDIRAAAVEVLGKLAAPSALPVLVERLKDESLAVVARAIAALGNFPSSPDLVSALRPFLQADNGELEGEAALALAHIGDTTSLDNIAALLSSPHVSSRMSAATALSLLPL